MSDLIERQSAIDALDEKITVTGKANAEAVCGYVNLICDRIKRLPSVQTELFGISEQLPSAQPEPSWDCEKCMMEHTDEMEKLEAELAIAKSKQPEPCEDAVSRTDVFNAVRGEERGGYVDETVECMLKVMSDLPSVTPKQKWIPCSPETMPKKTGYYLVQYTRKYCRNEMAVAFYSVEEARCDDDYTWEIETFSDIKEVIAWMPLPEPYREEGERK